MWSNAPSHLDYRDMNEEEKEIRYQLCVGLGPDLQRLSSRRGMYQYGYRIYDVDYPIFTHVFDKMAGSTQD